MKPPFFILGCVRSGTTLLRDLLRQHPGLICPEETHYYRWGEPFGMPSFVNTVGRSPLLKKHRSMDGIDEAWFQEQLALAGSRRDLFLRHAEAFRQAQGAPPDVRVFDKTPQHVYGIPLLLSDFPGAKFVHIVRNPLNVVASLMVGKVIAAPNVVAAANYWVEAVRIVNACRPILGADLHEIRYEDLVEAPRAALAAICTFVGEDPRPLAATMKVHRERNAYRDVLGAEDVGTVASICGALAGRYGYDLEVAR